ncbi:hypothetical protein POM88_009469 [Heracleum sosnowskyi]|uniref:Peptidase M48 domain-containing protein n=1 Tax=Heracleum sosnowskyi TaxID=360622 RepID=A0AAD8J9G5_9APIA|nr:hypothetical protein POM88_009469 [Heracleum sosnowskyi]
MEKTIGDLKFEVIKKINKGKILPAIHPDSIRVRMNMKEIVEALQRGLGDQTLMVSSDNAEGHWSKEDEIPKWVQQSRKKGQERGVQSTLSHLGLNWEILVVDKPDFNAFCIPGGKIVVFTGLLKHLQTNEEIATVIGHEVGHVVARHIAEGITKDLLFVIRLPQP